MVIADTSFYDDAIKNNTSYEVLRTTALLILRITVVLLSSNGKCIRQSSFPTVYDD